MPETVWLTGSDATVESIAKVARQEVLLAPTQDVLARLSGARAILDEVAASGQKIYGLNTGLGANLGASVVDPDDFQLALVRGRGMAFGPAYGREETRAIMAARLAMLSTGGSGISPRVFAGLADMLNAAIHPVMPSIGSTGASDLVLLSALAQALAGEGMVEHLGEIIPAHAALSRAGLETQGFAPKDGLSLISASAVSAGCGALLGDEVRTMLWHQRRAIALSFEGLGGNPAILKPQIQAARPSAGQRDEAHLISALLEGSSLHDAPTAIQDPLSLRCAASISGALSRSLDTFVGDVETELNASGDNPLVLLEERAVLSTGNFHVPALAISTEALGLAIGQAALASAARFICLTGGSRPGLPRYLSPLGGASAGFVPLQKIGSFALREDSSQRGAGRAGCPASLGGRGRPGDQRSAGRREMPGDRQGLALSRGVRNARGRAGGGVAVRRALRNGQRRMPGGRALCVTFPDLGSPPRPGCGAPCLAAGYAARLNEPPGHVAHVRCGSHPGLDCGSTAVDRRGFVGGAGGPLRGEVQRLMLLGTKRDMGSKSLTTTAS